MKIKGNEVMWLSPKVNVAVTYSQFALGAKYNIYRKVKYECDYGYKEVWEYSDSCNTYGEAITAAKKYNDLEVKR